MSRKHMLEAEQAWLNKAAMWLARSGAPWTGQPNHTKRRKGTKMSQFKTVPVNYDIDDIPRITESGLTHDYEDWEFRIDGTEMCDAGASEELKRQFRDDLRNPDLPMPRELKDQVRRFGFRFRAVKRDGRGYWQKAHRLGVTFPHSNDPKKAAKILREFAEALDNFAEEIR